MEQPRLMGRRVRVLGRDDIGRVVRHWPREGATLNVLWAVVVRFAASGEIGWYEPHQVELLD